MLKLLLPLLTIVLLASACDSGPDSVGDLTQDPSLLVGSWELGRVHSYWGGEAGPQDYNGPTESVEFRADGTFKQATAGEVRSEGTYEVEEGSIYVTAEYGRSWLGSFGVDRDDLIVNDRARDGAAQYYRRVE